jgi:hypothetical protein
VEVITTLQVVAAEQGKKTVLVEQQDLVAVALVDLEETKGKGLCPELLQVMEIKILAAEAVALVMREARLVVLAAQA